MRLVDCTLLGIGPLAKKAHPLVPGQLYSGCSECEQRSSELLGPFSGL